MVWSEFFWLFEILDSAIVRQCVIVWKSNSNNNNSKTKNSNYHNNYYYRFSKLFVERTNVYSLCEWYLKSFYAVIFGIKSQTKEHVEYSWLVLYLGLWKVRIIGFLFILGFSPKSTLLSALILFLFLATFYFRLLKFLKLLIQNLLSQNLFIPINISN